MAAVAPAGGYGEAGKAFLTARFGRYSRLFFPVVHISESIGLTLTTVGVAMENGGDGVFLIDHSGSRQNLMAHYAAVRHAHPALFVGKSGLPRLKKINI